MKKVEYYIAEDGSKFDDENQCKDYESWIGIGGNPPKLNFLDYDLLKLEGTCFENLVDAKYLYIGCEPAYAFIQSLDVYTPVPNLGVGCYRKDSRSGEWVKLEDEIRCLKDDLNFAESIIAKLKGESDNASI